MRGIAQLAERIRRTPPLAADAALALAIFAVGVIEVLFFLGPQANFHASTWSIGLFAAMALPLTLRRRNVWLAYALIQAAALSAIFLHQIVAVGLASILLANVLMFSVAERANGFFTTALVFGEVCLYYAADLQVPSGNPYRGRFVDDLQWLLPFFSLAAFAGWAQRRRRRLTAELEARAADLQRERERLSEQAVVHERVRIAQELRGLVIRGVEGMVRRAGAARAELRTDPGVGGERIAQIELSGRRTLIELRRLLGVLRRSGDAADSSGASEWTIPVPGRQVEPATGGLLGRIRNVRRWRGMPWLVDGGVVLGLGLYALLDYVRAASDDPTFKGVIPKLAPALMLTALLFRRKVPFTVFTIAVSMEFLWILITGNSPGSADRALWVAVYTVAAYKDIRWVLAAVLMATASWAPLPIHTLCLCLIDIGALSTFAAIAGHAMLVGRRLNRRLQEENDLLQRTRGERIRLALAEERARVAREMHDVVAHGVTVMVVQAGGARMVATTDPALAEETLTEIERMGSEAIQELRTLVAALDPVAEEAGPIQVRDETPDLEALVARGRRAGQEIELDEEGAPHVLDQGLQISLYRIVQEALTNARKHAPGAPVRLSIRHRPDAVEVEVRNGPGTAKPPRSIPGAGQGLVGIRERAAVFGGTVEAAPDPGGGFRLSVRLPLELVPA